MSLTKKGYQKIEEDTHASASNSLPLSSSTRHRQPPGEAAAARYILHTMGAHIGGDDGEHGTHAVHGHGVHHDDASDMAPIHVVRAVADHSTPVGHEMNHREG